MEKQMSSRKIPQSDSIEELARFWDTHDLTDFEDQLEEVTEPAGVGRVSAPNHSSEQAAMPLSKDRWGKRSVPIASRGADRTSAYVRNVGDQSVLAVEKEMLPGTRMRRSSGASIISPMIGADTRPNGMDSTLYLTAS